MKTYGNFYTYFEQLASEYPRYKKRFAYYWTHIINYANYFIQENDTVLEIGCGVGDSLNKLRGSNKTGIDFSPRMIEQARNQYPHLEFHVMDAARLSLDTQYDVIVLSNVLGYFDNVQDVLTALHRVCHPRTRIIIASYNYLWEPILRFAEFLRLKKRSPRQNWLSISDLKNLLYLSGFESYKNARRMLLPVYIPLISWLVNKFLAKLPLFNALCLDQFLFARQASEAVYSDAGRYSVSVVIPARNESGNIEDAITRMPQFGKSVEIIFIEGNSTDDTWEQIQAIAKKYNRTHNIRTGQQEGRGKGDAVRKGFDMATGDILMILDADLTVPPEELPKFYNAIATRKGEFINGSRLVYPMEKNAMRPLNEMGNRFFSSAFTWLLEQPLRDTLCGTKVIFASDYKKLTQNRSFFGDFDPFGDFDLIFGAYKLNLKIIDLPIRYQERTYGDTNISRFKHGWLLLRMVGFALGKIKFW